MSSCYVINYFCIISTVKIKEKELLFLLPCTTGVRKKIKNRNEAEMNKWILSTVALLTIVVTCGGALAMGTQGT